jgi:hypothetical protein
MFENKSEYNKYIFNQNYKNGNIFIYKFDCCCPSEPVISKIMATLFML